MQRLIFLAIFGAGKIVPKGNLRKRNRMKLSELKTGEHGVIVKVNGHGSFRKRIIEMGFVKGKSVKVILNAPL